MREAMHDGRSRPWTGPYLMSDSPIDPTARATEQTPEELVSRFARGDDSALGELVERETPRILNRVRSRIPRELRRRMGGSDLLQLTAAELVKMRGQFENRGVGAFREMVATITDRALATVVQRERALKRDLDREHHPEPAGDASSGGTWTDLGGAIDSRTPSRVARNREATRRLQECFESLSAEHRQIIELIDYECWPYSDAASLLGIADSTVRKRHSRAIARLRELMGGE